MQEANRDEPGSPCPAPLLRMSGVTKYFQDVPACREVDFDVAAGEIHGLLGQNGAGKSTLMNVLMGLVRSDRGSVELAGEPVTIRDPVEAREHGIGMVHQHYSLIPTLTVRQNITVSTRGRFKRDVLARSVRETSERYGLDVALDKRVDELSVGQQQRVEIVKCLIEQPRLLVLDEPTAVLTEHESHALFEMLRTMVGQVGSGVGSVILISHNLAEIRAVADRATIMRGGRVVATVSPAETPVTSLARQMIGRDLPLDAVAASAIGIGADVDVVVEPEPERPQPVLEIENATAYVAKREVLERLSLSVGAGEILGVAGVEGNGQQWLSALLSGGISLREGRVFVGGAEVRTKRAGAMRSAGVAVVPEDRRVSGCALDMTVAENIALGSLGALARRGVVSRRRVRGLAERLIDEFDISVGSLDQTMRTLSGGNQQKIVLARELSAGPRVLVLAQPTRGLDIGALEYVYQRVHDAAATGVAVVLISTDLTEILRLSDRIAVLYRGRVQGEMPRSEADSERIGLLMGGMAA
jgi:simple sugar transport system ATP-binding protein